MKAILIPTANGVPSIQLKPECPADEVALNAIVNRAGAPEDLPDVDYCLLAKVVNGDSYASITIGLVEE